MVQVRILGGLLEAGQRLTVVAHATCYLPLHVANDVGILYYDSELAVISIFATQVGVYYNDVEISMGKIAERIVTE